uniref:Dolichol-phosphate mannosyltransferase subunit 3 n=1 Tax=Solanum tuberosum TaxID=4113 RepID=M1C2Z2_SOLTU
MKHIVKILALLLAVTAVWIGLLQTSTIPESYTWLLPLYLIVSLGCYGLLMVGIGLMNFPTCPQEALFLQQVQLHFSFKKYCIPILLGLFKNVDGLVQDPPEVEEDIVEAREFLKKKGVDVGFD